MLDSSIKSIINTARDILVGKVPNPQSQVDLITIAMIYKFMDDMDNETVEFGGERSFFKDEKVEENEKGEKLSDEDNDKLGNMMSAYAWSALLSTSLGNEERMTLYSKALERLQMSKHIPELFRRIFKGAFLPFRDGATLTMFLKEINNFTYDNSENLGNAFEFLLSIMGSQGDAGQFRTPRHIIDFIVDVVNPTKEDTILDPACGTAGFLISAYKHILKHNSKDFDADNDVKLYANKVAESAEEIDIEISKNLRGDLLIPAERAKLTQNIVGYDISADMQKLALVNLYLHGFKDPTISEYDTLTSEKNWGDEFDVILANPPFMTPKGGIKPHNKFGIKANRSEVLFVDYIIEHLTLNGKGGVIVPEGIVFQSATAYKNLRKKMVEEDYLYAVVSLPSGVFNPYSGVKTSVLFFDRQIAKRAKEILFVNVKNDGFDLGANRRAIKDNDLLEAFNVIKDFQANHCNPELVAESISKSKLATLVDKKTIAKDGDYNLTGSRYIEAVDYSNCKWPMVKLADVCEINPNSFDPQNKYKDGYCNYIDISCIENGTGKLNSVNKIKCSEAPSRARREVQQNDVLLSTVRPNLKAFTILENIPENPVASTGFAILRSKKDILIPKYIYYSIFQDYLVSQMISKMGKGAYPSINQKDVESLEIILPPLEVQEEIVKEIDAYQQVIDGAKKVVENWKPAFPTNSKWKKVELEEVCSKITDGSHFSPQTTDTGFPYITVRDINDDLIDFKNCKYIDAQDYMILKKNGCKPNLNDVLFSKDGTVGKVSIVNYEKDFVVLSSLAILTPNLQKILPMYLKHILKSPDFLTLAIENKTGVAIKRIVLKTLKTIKITLPSIEEQKEIVAKIAIEEQAIEQCKNLLKIHEEKIANKIKSIWGEEDAQIDNSESEKEFVEV